MDVLCLSHLGFLLQSYHMSIRTLFGYLTLCRASSDNTQTLIGTLPQIEVLLQCFLTFSASELEARPLSENCVISLQRPGL